MKFDFGFRDGLMHAIRAKGFRHATEIQKQVIPLILNGKDVIACSRTGSGKTLAYLLPLIHLLGTHSTTIGARCLIIVPTRELALQIASNLKFMLKFLGPDAPHYTLLIGGHVYEGQFEELASNPDVIIATPGRLMEILQETDFSIGRIEHLVFDEADSLFEMGYKLQLQEILNRASHKRQTIMLSATLPASLDEFARAGLVEYVLAKVDSEYQLNDKLQVHALVVRSEERMALLVRMLQKLQGAAGQTIVFVSTRYVVELLEKVLKEHLEMQGGFLFGKMDIEHRTDVIADFRSQRIKFLVVTDLCARGIDIPEVDFIIHYEYPQTLKTFIHRSGRTARAGKQGSAFLFLTRHELPIAYEIERAVGREVAINEFDDFRSETTKPIDFDAFVDYQTSRKLGKVTSHPVFDQLFEKTGSIHLGTVPEDYLYETVHRIENLRKANAEVPRLEIYCRRGEKRFLVSRQPAERDAVKKARNAGLIKNHFFFYDADELFKEAVTGIQNFKPQASVFELKYVSKLGNAQEMQQSIDKLRELKKKATAKAAVKRPVAMEVEEEGDGGEQGDDYEIEMPVETKAKPQGQTRFSSKEELVNIFRDPRMFVAYEEDKGKVEDFMRQHQITAGEVDNLMLADENQDLYKVQKQVWDAKRRKFKKVTVNARGEQIDADGTKLKVIKDKMKRLGSKFNKWKKHSQVQIGQAGAPEDQETVARARTMFKDRKNQKFRPRQESPGRGGQEGGRRKPGKDGRLKTAAELLAGKRKKEIVKMKNMPREAKQRMREKKGDKGGRGGGKWKGK